MKIFNNKKLNKKFVMKNNNNKLRKKFPSIMQLVFNIFF